MWWIFEFDLECSWFCDPKSSWADESESEREISEIVVIKIQFPQTASLFRSETKNEFRSGGDSEYMC